MADKTLTAAFVVDAAGVGKGTQETAAYLDKVKDDFDATSAKVDTFQHNLDQLNKAVDAKVTVSGDADERLDEVKQRLADLGKAVTSARVLVDDNEAQGELSDLEAKLVKINGKVTPEVGIGGIAQAESDLTKVQTALETFRDENVKPKITVDDEDSEERLAKIKVDLDQLGTKVDVAKVQLAGDADAMAKVLAFEAELDRINAKVASGKVTLDGVPDTEAKILTIDASLDKLNDKKVEPKVDSAGISDASSKTQQLGSSADSASGGMSKLVMAAVGLGPALIPIGAAAAGGLAALPGLFAGAASAAGALKLGFSGVGAALSASQQPMTSGASAANQVQQAMASAAQSAQSSAQAVASAQQGLGQAVQQAAQSAVSAAEAVTNAQEAEAQAVQTASYDAQTAVESLQKAQQAAADAEVQAAQQILSAQQAQAQSVQSLANAQYTAAQQNISAQQALANSEQSLQNAEHSELTAQQALTQARIDAANQLQSLNDQVADGALAQQQAALDVTAAQKAMAQGPTSTTTAAQLQLNYEMAVQRVKDLADQQSQLQQQTDLANKKGVEGSTQVQSALWGVHTAVEGVGNAQQTVANDAAAAARAQVTGAQQVAAAQQAVGNADRALQQAQVSGAESVRNAQQAVADTERSNARQAQSDAQSIQKAQQGVSDALRNQANTAQSSAASIAKAQQAVADALANQKMAAQQSAIAIRSAETSGATGANAFAAAMAKLTPAGQQFVNFLRSNLVPQFDAVKAKVQSALLPPIEDGIKAAEPALTLFGQSLETSAGIIGKLADNFGHFLGSAQGLHDVNALLNQGNQALAGIGGAATKFVQAFMNIGAQAGPIVSQLVGSVGNLASMFLKFSTSGGLTSLLGYIEQNGPLVGKLLGAVSGALGGVVKALAPAGSTILANLVPAIQKLTPGLVAMAQALGKILQAVAPMLPPLASLISTVAKLVAAAASASPTLTAMGVGAIAAGAGVAKLIKPIAGVIGGLGQAAKDVSAFSSVLHGAKLAEDAGPIGKLAEGFHNIGDFAGAAKGKLGDMASGAKNLALKLFGVVPAEEAATVGATEMDGAMDANPIGLIILAIAALGVGIYELVKHFSAVTNFLSSVWNGTIGNAIKAVMPFVSLPVTIISHWHQIVGFFEGMWSDIKAGLSDAEKFFTQAWTAITNGVTAGVKAVVGFFQKLPGEILKALGDAGKWLLKVGSDAVTGLWNGIKGYETWLLHQVVAVGTWIETALSDAAKWLLGIGGDVIHGLWTGITDVQAWVVGQVKNIGRWVENALSDAATWLVRTGGQVIHGLWSGITGAVGTVTGWFQGLGQMVINAIGDAGSMLLNVGEAIIQGLVNGIENGAGGVVNAVQNIVSQVKNIPIIGGLFGSPSPYFTEVGEMIGQGATNGINNRASQVVGATAAMVAGVRSEGARMQAVDMSMAPGTLTYMNRAAGLGMATGPYQPELAPGAVSGATGGASGATGLLGGVTWNGNVVVQVPSGMMGSPAELAAALAPTLRTALISLSQRVGASGQTL